MRLLIQLFALFAALFAAEYMIGCQSAAKKQAAQQIEQVQAQAQAQAAQIAADAAVAAARAKADSEAAKAVAATQPATHPLTSNSVYIVATMAGWQKAHELSIWILCVSSVALGASLVLSIIWDAVASMMKMVEIAAEAGLAGGAALWGISLIGRTVSPFEFWIGLAGSVLVALGIGYEVYKNYAAIQADIAKLFAGHAANATAIAAVAPTPTNTATAVAAKVAVAATGAAVPTTTAV
jgi:hypothetical protein